MNKKIDLNGTWLLRWDDGQRGGRVTRFMKPQSDLLEHAIQAQVPGEVHLDLVRAGLLQEPGEGLNCLAARWVEETIWYYRRSFEAPRLSAGERAWLVFECLDLAAVIYLNGKEVGRHTNSFYPCRVEVTDALQPGENTVVVSVESGLFLTMERPSQGFGMHLDSQLAKRNWLRKVQSSFGWDWSTRLLNVGICGNAYLEIASEVRYERMAALVDVSPDLQLGKVTGRLFVEGLIEKPQRGELTVEIEGTGQKTTKIVYIQPGTQDIEATVTLEKPELWWPVNHGKQPLYTIKTTLSVGDKVVTTDTRKVGFRRAMINQTPHPESGNYFILEINNKPIFVKGANFVPADMIPARLDRARYATLMDRALEANMNMLRVWGGGLYESDHLYEICDERGVLVWQEFIFACAKYPTYDEEFLADVKREATYQVRRLVHHPSLVVWCGNNEMEEGNFHWFYDQGVAHPDYALFHLVLPVILKQEDGTRYYQPSSPFSPDHESPRRDDMGDQHPWTVGFANTDFRDYRQMTSRFPNEGGILGATSLPTVKACLPPDQYKPGSFAFEIHDNSVSYWGDDPWPNNMLEQWLGKSIDQMTIEDYVYYAGLIQGEGLSEYIRNFRRRMFNTASAIFWMYNDCWPASRSWTVVDYYLRRTPAFYPVRRAFKPLTVALAHEDGKVKVFGINEGSGWKGDLRYGLFCLTGGLPVDLHKKVDLPENTSTLIAEFSAVEWERLGEMTHGAFAILSRDGNEVARDRLFLPYYKELVWQKPGLIVRREGEKAIFESKTFVWRVCLDLDGERSLPDNFFDVLPGIPTVLDWPGSLSEPEVLRTGNLV